MGMRAQHVAQPNRQPRPGVLVAVIVIVIMPGVMAVGMRMTHDAKMPGKP